MKFGAPARTGAPNAGECGDRLEDKDAVTTPRKRQCEPGSPHHHKSGSVAALTAADPDRNHGTGPRSRDHLGKYSGFRANFP